MAWDNRWTFDRDWPAIRAELLLPGTDGWPGAVRILNQRLITRYLAPIDQMRGDMDGEGFAIMTILCSLIEFLAALRLGLEYEHGWPQFAVNNKYGQSGRLYKEFLCTTQPFAAVFNDPNNPDQPKAAAFWSSVRNGLLHEGQTKDGWRIRVSKRKQTAVALDFTPGASIVYRDLFLALTRAYLHTYCNELLTTTRLQHAFIRKFDHLHRHL